MISFFQSTLFAGTCTVCHRDIPQGAQVFSEKSTGNKWHSECYPDAAGHAYYQRYLLTKQQPNDGSATATAKRSLVDAIQMASAAGWSADEITRYVAGRLKILRLEAILDDINPKTNAERPQ